MSFGGGGGGGGGCCGGGGGDGGFGVGFGAGPPERVNPPQLDMKIAKAITETRSMIDCNGADLRTRAVPFIEYLEAAALALVAVATGQMMTN